MANMMQISGVKPMTDPTPPMMPDTTSDCRSPSGMNCVPRPASQVKPSSIQPWG